MCVCALSIKSRKDHPPTRGRPLKHNSGQHLRIYIKMVIYIYTHIHTHTHPKKMVSLSTFPKSTAATQGPDPGPQGQVIMINN